MRVGTIIEYIGDNPKSLAIITKETEDCYELFWFKSGGYIQHYPPVEVTKFEANNYIFGTDICRPYWKILSE